MHGGECARGVCGGGVYDESGHQTVGNQGVRNGVKMLCELTVASFSSPGNCLFPGKISK